MATTSFRKKTVSPRHQQHPKGTRLSLHNAQLLASTGVASLDALLGIVRLPCRHTWFMSINAHPAGGGVPVGTVILVGELCNNTPKSPITE